MPENFVTPPGVISWPHLYEPKAVVAGGEPRYSVTLILDQIAQKDALWQAIRKAVGKAIDDKWGAGKSRDQNFVRGLLLPWKPCSNKSQYQGFDVPGGIYINPWSKKKPSVFDRKVSLIADPDEVWAGQIAKLSISIFSYIQSANKGVSMNLNNVQIIRVDAPRIDGRPTPGTEFRPEGPDDDDDAFSGATPADPFGDRSEIPF